MADRDSTLSPILAGYVSSGTTESLGNNGTQEGAAKCYRAPSLIEQVRCFQRNRKKIARWARLSRRMRTVGLWQCGTLAALGYQLAKVNAKNAERFFEQLIEGTNLGKTDPVRALRERLIRERSAKAKTSRFIIAGLLVKAWCLWNKGWAAERLVYNASGPRAEDFPDHRDVAA